MPPSRFVDQIRVFALVAKWSLLPSALAAHTGQAGRLAGLLGSLPLTRPIQSYIVFQETSAPRFAMFPSPIAECPMLPYTDCPHGLFA